VAVSVFKTACGPTSSGWVGSIPMHSRHASTQGMEMFAMNSRLSVARRAFGATGLLVTVATSAGAQQRDTLPASRTTSVGNSQRDSLKPPLTPKRSFLYALAVPGLPQSIFGRHRAAAGMLAVEAISWTMIHESSGDVSEARRARIDTLTVSYVGDDGRLLEKPVVRPGTFTSTDVRARRTHVEDWIAMVLANHLFSAADAYVSAHLWDVPAQVGFRLSGRGAVVTARIRW
jgi:hypothetical protein